MILCVTGLCMHPFFYSILVSLEFKIFATAAQPLWTSGTIVAL